MATFSHIQHPNYLQNGFIMSARQHSYSRVQSKLAKGYNRLSVFTMAY